MKSRVNFNIKSALNYLLLILVTSLGITTILISLPLTEKVSKKTTFDILTKENFYWSNAYYLTVQTTDQKEIEQTRNILFRRLHQYGVEKISVRNIEQSEDSTTLKIVVNSTKEQDIIQELISNKFDIQIVIKKEDVDFFDSENQYTYLFAENYESTEWDRNDFRNVHVTKLRTSEGTYAFFAIFKPWVNKQGAFNNFLDRNKGNYVGVNIDGFVTPYLVPIEKQQSIFAIPLTVEDEEQIEAISILYNAGVIPVEFSIEKIEELTPQIIQLDHIRVSIGLFISFLLVYAYMLLLKKNDPDTLLKSFLATVLSISIYITVLKLTYTPIDTFLLPILGILTAMLIKIISANKDSVIYIELSLIIVLTTTMLLSYGYTNILATHLLYLTILSKLSLIFSNWYINKVKNI